MLQARGNLPRLSDSRSACHSGSCPFEHLGTHWGYLTAISRRRALVILSLAATLVFGAALPALAVTTCTSTPGSRACWTDTSNVITAQDTRVDGREVYTDWCLSNSSSQSSCSSFTRLYNSGDNLDTVSVTVSVGSFSRIVFRSCIAIPLWPDQCTSWTNAAT
jgi:hypothetical protein